MRILAFDTSGTATSVAVGEGKKILAERTFDDLMTHSTTLLPTIDEVMREAGIIPSTLTHIAVAQGPGSYTGLRIAVTAAKTLAFTLETKLVGISSLRSLAFSEMAEDVIVVPLMNARRDNVYAAAYQGADTLLVDQHVHLMEFLSIIEKNVNNNKLIFTGDAEIFADKICEKFPTAQIKKNGPSASGIAQMAMRVQPVSNIHDFNPTYLKKVEAEEKWEAKSGIVSDNRKLVSQI